MVAVNLYAGNQYWFSVGANEAAKKFTVRVYDESGKPMQHGDISRRSERSCRIFPDDERPVFRRDRTDWKAQPALFASFIPTSE